jgi:hypothetical protein
MINVIRQFRQWAAASARQAGYDETPLFVMLAHDLREFALLWVVFANLDKLINDRFEWRFAIIHTLGGSVLWLYGARLELKPEKAPGVENDTGEVP